MTNDEIRMTKSSDHQDFSAPQRPKPWLLRTRRFWFGMWVLFLLTGTWIGAGQFTGSLEYVSELKGESRFSTFSLIAISNGKMIISQKPNTITCANLWCRAWNRNNGYDFWPKPFDTEVTGETYQLYSDFGVVGPSTGWVIQIPLWLPVLLWLIIWPLWIRRLTRKEAAHFAKLQ